MIARLSKNFGGTTPVETLSILHHIDRKAHSLRVRVPIKPPIVVFIRDLALLLTVPHADRAIKHPSQHVAIFAVSHRNRIINT